MSIPFTSLEDFCVDYDGHYELSFIGEDGEALVKISDSSLDDLIGQTNNFENAVSEAIQTEYIDKVQSTVEYVDILSNMENV